MTGAMVGLLKTGGQADGVEGSLRSG
jgi:hypothetical protein